MRTPPSCSRPRRRNAVARHQPELLLVGASCTAELIQDDPGGLAAALNLPVPVVALELPAYSKKENWGAAETFYRIVRACCPVEHMKDAAVTHPSCNILGPTALGFRHRDDVREVTAILDALGIAVNVVRAARRLARGHRPGWAMPTSTSSSIPRPRRPPRTG